jgi:hypothetical protein
LVVEIPLGQEVHEEPVKEDAFWYVPTGHKTQADPDRYSPALQDETGVTHAALDVLPEGDVNPEAQDTHTVGLVISTEVAPGNE